MLAEAIRLHPKVVRQALRSILLPSAPRTSETMNPTEMPVADLLFADWVRAALTA